MSINYLIGLKTRPAGGMASSRELELF